MGSWVAPTPVPAPAPAPVHSTMSSSGGLYAGSGVGSGGGGGGGGGGIWPAGPSPGSGSGVGPVSEDVLHKLTERITQRLRLDLESEIRKEAVLETEKQEELRSKLYGYLQSELKTHSCPMCGDVMAAPKVPYLLCPCGHTFCAVCVDAHRRRSNTCPFCCTPIESAAVNHTLRHLVDMFVAKKLQYERGGLELTADSAGAIALGQAVGRLGETGYGSRPFTTSGYGGDMGPGHAYSTGPYPPHAGYPGVGYPGGPGSAGPGSVMGGFGRAPSAPSAEHMDQAIRYLHDLRSYAMRYQIVENERAANNQKRQECAERLTASAAAIHHLEGEEAGCRKRLEQVQQELTLLTSYLKDMKTKREEIAGEQDSLSQSDALLSETMESLRREIQKARVLVQNFAPHLLTTGDIAVASE